MVALLVKAVVASLKAYPEVNSSLDGDELILKRYYHIGFAADTPQGLLVPVIKDVDRKGLLEIAGELTSSPARRARASSSGDEMQGATFTISSLGGIGGTCFTPIVNAPEVAILGVSRSAMKPVWDGSAVRAAADGAAVALLRPPRDRRRARRALHRPPGRRARRHAAGAAVSEVRVPDIGDFTDVPVIEILVAPGDKVAAEDPLVTLESDKATMDVPSPAAGTVGEMLVAVGDKVSQGTPILDARSVRRRRRRASRRAEAEAPPPRPAPADDGGGGDDRVDVVVLGAGPGGYTAAFRAADLGLKTVLVERYERLGGVCLNVGCIPSKALLHLAARDRRGRGGAEQGITLRRAGDRPRRRARVQGRRGRASSPAASPGMAKRRKVAVVHGAARFTGAEHARRRRRRRSRSSTASSPPARSAVELPGLPDDPRIVDSTGALELPDIPERLLVIGGGIIGLEMATVLRRARLQGHGRRDARPAHPGLRPGPRQAAAQADREALRGDPPRHARREDPSRPRTTACTPRFGGDEETLRPHPRRRRPPPQRRPLDADAAGVEVDERGFIHVDAPAAHERPAHLRHRRRRRRADARPQGDARGEGRRPR